MVLIINGFFFSFNRSIYNKATHIPFLRVPTLFSLGCYIWEYSAAESYHFLSPKTIHAIPETKWRRTVSSPLFVYDRQSLFPLLSVTSQIRCCQTGEKHRSRCQSSSCSYRSGKYRGARAVLFWLFFVVHCVPFFYIFFFILLFLLPGSPKGIISSSVSTRWQKWIFFEGSLLFYFFIFIFYIFFFNLSSAIYFSIFCGIRWLEIFIFFFIFFTSSAFVCPRFESSAVLVDIRKTAERKVQISFW